MPQPSQISVLSPHHHRYLLLLLLLLDPSRQTRFTTYKAQSIIQAFASQTLPKCVSRCVTGLEHHRTRLTSSSSYLFQFRLINPRYRRILLSSLLVLSRCRHHHHSKRRSPSTRATLAHKSQPAHRLTGRLPLFQPRLSRTDRPSKFLFNDHSIYLSARFISISLQRHLRTLHLVHLTTSF